MTQLMANPANPIHAHWRKHLTAYAFAAGISAFTLQAEFILSPWLGDHPAYILFILPVIFGAYVGGLGPGLLATAICAAGIYHFQLARPTTCCSSKAPLTCGIGCS